MNQQPLVSVGMLVYNHGKYLEKAIESILMQEVNFRYEIVIADDYSTDNSRDIIMKYYKKYPEIIKPILQERNVGMRLNSDTLRHNCIGKYRATLEGDDFWITTDKLQKQVSFLENNQDYIAIGADFTCVDDDNKPCSFPWGDIKYTYCQDSEYTLKHVNEWLLPGHASTMLFRNVFHTCSKEMLEEFEKTMILGDRRTTLFLVLQGKVKHVNEVVMVRRVLRKSKTSMTNMTAKMNWQATNYGWLLEAERFAKDVFDVTLDLQKIKEKRWFGALKVFLLNPSKDNLSVVIEIFKLSDSKFRYLNLAMIKIYNKIKNKLKREGIVKASINLVYFVIKFIIKFLKNMKSKEKKEEKSILRSFSK